jgi:hypothetical protein
MFKDQKEELRRLEEELLKDQELYDPALPEEFEEDALADEPPEEFDEDLIDRDIPTPNGWNTDDADEDLEALSQEVYDTRPRRNTGLLGFAAGLLLLAAILGWLVLKERGMLP